ncbi:hypothetical protein CLOP_g13542 [Closterium sp. NIES-67]|nr:hypothetical protein CLOP_g13542 [Closterium sp. NIES-67]
MESVGFDARKAAVLAALASVERDRSLKGGLDAPIADLVAEINGHDDLFTTSSCSGRISLLLEPHAPAAAAAAAGAGAGSGAGAGGPSGGEEGEGPGEGAGGETRVKKKARGGEWLLVSHDPIDPTDLVRAVFATSTACAGATTPPPSLPGELVFRFEPLILALECRCLAAAQQLVSCAIRAGFRESASATSELLQPFAAPSASRRR